jgi:hypothetical protein
MAAAETGREVHYFTFYDTDFAERLGNFYKTIMTKHPTVGKNRVGYSSIIFIKSHLFFFLFLKEKFMLH